MEELLNEILRLQKENNVLLKEIVSYIRKVKDPNYVMEQDVNDFVMNVVANLFANDLEKGRNINNTK